MKLKFPLIAILLLIMTASCSETDIQEEQSLYTEESQEITENTPALNATAFENEVLDVVNEYRASQGLNTLAFSSEAYIDAEDHTMYMIKKGKLSHDNFNARAAQVSKKTKASLVAENVAKSYDTADKVLEAWLASSSHKNTIEGDFTHSSITAREDANGTLYYTQIFFKK